MTQPLLAHQTEFGRMYSRTLSGVPEVPSITTVIAQQPADLTGWAGHMAAQAVINDPRLPTAVHAPGQLKTLARHASSAAERFRDDAAARGDRVHQYAEQVALRALGEPHDMSGARSALAEHNESAFADRFDEWWDLYEVRPLAAEVTVWNQSVGYAGTLDLVASIGGRTCLIDYKTKGTDRNGRVKTLDPKVVMQLVAGLKAEESLIDPEAGTWGPWAHADAAILMGVAVGETEVVAYQANPQVLPEYWRRFWSLRQAWDYGQQAERAGQALRPIAPPPSSTNQPVG
ncbi:cytochrome [Citricoccus sp. NR2]|uniref:cytochrome n=1 Tax=Citricoccus sp. NR2 TaxID=3004095 RepID=UPI0022DD0368|nr:cytochrome [Citricoccus sp. NR2]WBL18375.1 cytochrome [Citricoccus sp. NR2]